MKSKIIKVKDDIFGDISDKASLRIPYFVFTISLIATCVITYYFYSSAKTIDSQRFTTEVTKVRNAINTKLETYLALLRASRGYFKSSQKVDKKSFENFVDSLSLREIYPGIQGIGYSIIFTQAEKEALEKQMIEEGYQTFSVRPDTPRDQYQSIIYIAPVDDRNMRAVGYDMSSEPTRKLAIDTARDSGVYAITGKVLLMQDTETPGFLIYLPVYKSEDTPQTLEAKRENIQGFIYSPFRANEFVKDVIKELSNRLITFKIYDESLQENNLLAIGNSEQTPGSSDFIEESRIELNNRHWVIVYTPTAAFTNQSLIWWTPIIFILGLSFSVILFVLSLSQLRTNEKLIKTAQDLAFSQLEVQKLLESETAAREKAEKAGKVKTEFISTVSHELRTPLNAIAGWLTILKSNNLNPETKTKAIETIDKNLRSQVNLVEDMIIFSDASYLNNLNLEEVFSFNELLKDCLEEVKIKAKEKEISIFSELRGEKDSVKGNSAKLKKTILRLFDNAVKFTPSQGQISVYSTSNEKELELRIADTGEGIDPEKLSLVFGDFQQLDSSNTRKRGGLGLGMAIAKKVIGFHNGEISAHSEGIGKGTTILIKLPLAE